MSIEESMARYREHLTRRRHQTELAAIHLGAALGQLEGVLQVEADRVASGYRVEVSGLNTSADRLVDQIESKTIGGWVAWSEMPEVLVVPLNGAGSAVAGWPHGGSGGLLAGVMLDGVRELKAGVRRAVEQLEKEREQGAL